MVWKKANIRKKVWHSKQQDLRMEVRKVTALAFMPVDRVVEVFDELRKTSPEELKAVYQHMEDYYVKGKLGKDGKTRGKIRYEPPVSTFKVMNLSLFDNF